MVPAEVAGGGGVGDDPRFVDDAGFEGVVPRHRIDLVRLEECQHDRLLVFEMKPLRLGRHNQRVNRSCVRWPIPFGGLFVCLLLR